MSLKTLFHRLASAALVAVTLFVLAAPVAADPPPPPPPNGGGQGSGQGQGGQSQGNGDGNDKHGAGIDPNG